MRYKNKINKLRFINKLQQPANDSQKQEYRYLVILKILILLFFLSSLPVIFLAKKALSPTLEQPTSSKFLYPALKRVDNRY